MWHQLIYKYCVSCHIHLLFLYAGKSEPREKSSAGLAPPTPQLCAGNPEFPLHLQVARGAWILMLRPISYTVYFNLQKLVRVCVSRHRRLEDKINIWKFLGNYCHSNSLLCRLCCSYALVSCGQSVRWRLSIQLADSWLKWRRETRHWWMGVQDLLLCHTQSKLTVPPAHEWIMDNLVSEHLIIMSGIPPRA